MPNYNYTCTTCDSTHQEIRTMCKRKVKTTCVKCGDKALLSPSLPTIILDGSDPNFVGAHDRWVKEHETKGNGVRSF
jgi:putative FmdB family regulatory protein